jgi:broad specificity phosphatase PhoE
MNEIKTYCHWLQRFTCLIALLVIFPVSVEADEEKKIWNALMSGDHVALLRHTLAPGTGDPPQINIEDCATQRNLSEQGRQQAKRIGDRFRVNGIDSVELYSSQWCRCLDTAQLLDLGAVQPLEPLNSFFQNFERREHQTAELEQWIRSQPLDRPVLLVTHQVNITALTGAFVNSGELVVVKVPAEGAIEIVGSLNTM